MLIKIENIFNTGIRKSKWVLNKKDYIWCYSNSILVIPVLLSDTKYKNISCIINRGDGRKPSLLFIF
ncbi:hypothetical protein HMPREF1983_01041 [Gemella bergeri ATCC 700627]|uniref:Uncharacterized protein n=1 Tax=Gemella bergeri ATCC 700627 TaxID=1321820 RepID=U2S484_9BACL|nr:hypothetical protein HMPREF1983_01041 [Gemella bergeri ATCC 700627]